MSAQSTRKVKLQPKFRSLATSQKIVPELKISGLWLSEHGFEAGCKVEITVANKELIIKAL